MPTYETTLILKPVLSDPEVAELAEKTKQSIVADGGEILVHEIWGRRKLTHMIDKARDGVYAYFKFRSSPSLLEKLNHNFSISEQILRAMTVTARDRKFRDKKKKKAKTHSPGATSSHSTGAPHVPEAQASGAAE